MKYLTLCLCILFSAATLIAQLPPDVEVTHQHTVDSPQVIDGSQNPDLIPDNTAYRLFFVAIADSPDSSDVDKVRHQTGLNRIRLSKADGPLFAAEVNAFRQKYDALIKSYNQTVEVALATGKQPDLDSFLAQRDALVQGVRDRLKSSLSSDGVQRVQQFIQNEKRQMKVQVVPSSAK